MNLRNAMRTAARPFLGLCRLIARWNTRIVERQYLAFLQERERRDAGISSYDVEWERRKSFWRE